MTSSIGRTSLLGRRLGWPTTLALLLAGLIFFGGCLSWSYREFMSMNEEAVGQAVAETTLSDAQAWPDSLLVSRALADVSGPPIYSRRLEVKAEPGYAAGSLFRLRLTVAWESGAGGRRQLVQELLVQRGVPELRR